MSEGEGILLLDPADARAQQIGRAIASPLAGEILRRFASGPMTLSRISEELSVPINTAKYHVENLLEAGLLEVVDTRYSEKGREMKLYGLRNQVVIVAPRRADVRALLTKYASIFTLIISITLFLAILQPFLLIPVARNMGVEKAMDSEGVLVSSVPEQCLETPHPTPLYPMEAVLAFFAGASLVLVLLLLLERKRIAPE